MTLAMHLLSQSLRKGDKLVRINKPTRKKRADHRFVWSVSLAV